MTKTIIAGERVSSRHAGLASVVTGAPCQADPDLWFPEPGDHAAEAAAKAGCMTCPYRAACLAIALAARETHGVWGGLTAAERREADPRTCPRCGKATAPRRTYCGDTCANDARNASRGAAAEMRRARRRGLNRQRRARLHTAVAS
jgi:hypothetical protein